MSNDALIDQIACGDAFVAWAAAERYAENARPEDAPRLMVAYDVCPSEDVGLRMEIVDLIGRFDSPEAHAFLKRAAHARAHIWVRYSAIRNMIELGYDDWRPGGLRELRSEFYRSLLAFERYWRREIGFDEFRALGLARTKGRGDFWEWVAHLEPRAGEASPA